MEKRFLGKIEVSPIGIGTMAFSHGYGHIPDEQYSIEAIRGAYDFGCNFFDTAEVYSPNLSSIGHNELIVGKALESVRKNLVLATKLHIKSEEIHEHSVYEVVKKHLLGSMQRLRTDYVDLYYLHRINPEVALEEVAAAMGRLIEEGAIRGWGLSQVSAQTLEIAHKITPVSAVQNLYNMLERDCEKDIFPYTLRHNIGVVPFSPTASGFLSGKITVQTQFEKTDDVRNWVPQLSRENIIANQPIVDMVKKFAELKHATAAQIALAWMLHKYSNVVPIPGSKNKERMIENLAAWNVELSDSEFSELDSALDAIKVHGHRGHVEDENTRFIKAVTKED